MKKKLLLILFAAVFIGCTNKKSTEPTEAQIELAKAEAAKAQAEAELAIAQAEATKAEAEQAAAEAQANAARARAQAAPVVTRAAVINANEWINIRERPSLKSEVIMTMWSGDVFYVDYSSGKQWYPVRESQTGPCIGYVFSQLVRLI